MAGTVYDVISTYAGLNLRGSIPELNPSLPGHWKGLDFRFMHRGTHFQVSITESGLKISGENAGKDKIKVHLCEKEIELSQDEPVSVPLN
jgi:trehalose/maltose hydrolase-like predicted phosphorylase